MISLIGCLVGYIVGIIVWDKFILPILERQRKEKELKTFLEYIKICKIIGNLKCQKE